MRNTSSFVNFMRTMSQFDLRYAIPIFINLHKSESKALFTTYNPHQTTWIKLCFTFLMLLLFSTTSMNVPLTPPSPNNITTLIRFQFGNFSPPHLALSLVASLVLSRALFWYSYPAILIFALCFSSLLFLQLRRFSNWVNNKLGILPVWNLHINYTLTHEHDHHRTEAEIDIEAQAPLPQHGGVDQISPEDGDSLAEPSDGLWCAFDHETMTWLCFWLWPLQHVEVLYLPCFVLFPDK